MQLNWKCVGGNDLYADRVECSCLDKHWADKPEVSHLFKTKITLSGYYDANFFDNVNKEPHNSKCSCGRGFTYQWFRTHVEFNWDK